MRGTKSVGGGVVGVEDGGLGNALVDAFVQHLEQAALRREVAGLVAVEVEVVAAEGREDGDIELALVDAVERQAVRGRLDDGVAPAAVDARASDSCTSGDSSVVMWVALSSGARRSKATLLR